MKKNIFIIIIAHWVLKKRKFCSLRDENFCEFKIIFGGENFLGSN